MKNISFPTEKKCGRCKKVKPFTEFYIVPSYSDNLARICKPCNSEDGQIRQHRRQLAEQGREKFAERIRRLTSTSRPNGIGAEFGINLQVRGPRGATP